MKKVYQFIEVIVAVTIFILTSLYMYLIGKCKKGE